MRRKFALPFVFDLLCAAMLLVASLASSVSVALATELSPAEREGLVRMCEKRSRSPASRSVSFRIPSLQNCSSDLQTAVDVRRKTPRA